MPRRKPLKVGDCVRVKLRHNIPDVGILEGDRGEIVKLEDSTDIVRGWPLVCIDREYFLGHSGYNAEFFNTPHRSKCWWISPRNLIRLPRRKEIL